MKYGYARVSTVGQARNGTSLEGQREELIRAGAEAVYADAYTGTTSHRPELAKLMDVLKAGDEIIVTKLDRISRSLRDGLELVDTFRGKGVAVNVLNMGKFDDTPNGKLMRSIFFAFAEFEHDMIIARTQEGLERKKASGWQPGRKRKEIEITEGNIEEQCRALGISRATYYRRRKENDHRVKDTDV